MGKRIDSRMVPRNVKNPLQIAQEQRKASELNKRYRNIAIWVAATIWAIFLMKSYLDKPKDNDNKVEIYNELSK
jgi:hypothetical protein